MQVHPVQQRTADFVQVQANLGKRAGAGTGGVPVVAAGAGVHGAHQHKAAGVGRPAPGPADGDDPVLQRLPQRFHGGAAELRQLIQEQHPVVRQRDLPRPRDAAAAGQPYHRNGVVRRTEHPIFQQRDPGRQKPGRRVDLGGLHRLLKAHLRQDGGQTLGQHALAGAGRPDQQHVVAARRRDLQGALGVFLPLHLAEIQHRRLGQLPERQAFRRRQRLAAGQRIHQLPHRPYRVDPDPLHHTALGGVVIGDVDAGIALPGRFRDHRKDAVDRAQPSIQRNFPHKGAARQRKIQPAARGQRPQQNGQVVQRAAFFGIRRGQVDHQNPRRESVPQVPDGAVNPLPAFFDRGIRQPHDIKAGQSPAEIHLHRYRVALDPGQAHRLYRAKHGFSLLFVICAGGKRRRPAPPASPAGACGPFGPCGAAAGRRHRLAVSAISIAYPLPECKHLFIFLARRFGIDSPPPFGLS